MGCRQIANKIELIRIARITDGEIRIDRFCRMQGRGAYVHPSAKCLEATFRRKAVQRSLKIDFDDGIVENIKKELEKIKH